MWSFRRKPAFWAPGLRRGHPLARGLVLAAPLSEPAPADRWPAFDCAGRATAAQATRVRRVGRLGPGAGHPGGEDVALAWPDRSRFAVGAFTAAALVGYGAARATDGTLMARGTEPVWRLREAPSGGAWYTGAVLAFAEGGTFVLDIETGNMPAGNLCLAVLRVAESLRSVRVDLFSTVHGHQWAQETWPAGKTLRSASGGISLGDLPGAGGTAQSGWSGLLYGGWFWDRRLGDGRVFAFARDPFAMFRYDQHREALWVRAVPPPPPASWSRRRLWGSDEAFAGRVSMRPASSRTVYGAA